MKWKILLAVCFRNRINMACGFAKMVMKNLIQGTWHLSGMLLPTSGERPLHGFLHGHFQTELFCTHATRSVRKVNIGS